MGKLTLSGRGRRRVVGGHPWIYADDVAHGEGEAGELLAVHGPNDERLGWGLFSPRSKIAVRLVTRGSEQPKRDFWLARVRSAVELRASLGRLAPDGACRLLSGEAEAVPGLVVDRYRDVLVLSSGTPGADRMRDFAVELLEECLPFPVRAVLDRSDAPVRRLEGLDARVEWIRGDPVDVLEVVEAEEPDAPRLVYEVLPEAGHKTGHYLDQVENRRRAARFAAGRDVLDVFSYDGLFGIRAALAGAKSVLALDQSAEAGERLLRNAERNGVADRVRFERVNAMRDLKRRVEGEARYGLVLLDPPPFAKNKREIEGAARGYRELARRGLGLTAPGGVLVLSSCSYHVRRDALLGHLARGAQEAGRNVQVFAATGAAADHPVSPFVPESEYLKCLFVHVP